MRVFNVPEKKKKKMHIIRNYIFIRLVLATIKSITVLSMSIRKEKKKDYKATSFSILI